MKIKKKTAMLASFTIGTLLFATTALADVVSKSGYDQLKDGLKVSAKKMSGEFNSFTLDMTYVIKDNGKTLQSENHVEKNDRKNNVSETTNTSEGLNGNGSNYTYSDNKTDIRRGIGLDDKVYVMEYTEERKLNQFPDPFAQNGAEDVERIADAVIGSLKDHVIVKDNSDGSKELTGSLSEMQIPALVNAVASFQLKQQFNGRNGMQNEWPHLTQDVFVKEVTGSASINKDGVLENILGTATVSGKDSQGQAHDITVEVLGKLKDVNSTKVTKPDLTGKEVVKQTVQQPNRGPELTNPQKFLGTFKNDIIIEKEGKFVKTGERILEITKIDSNGVTGRYHEEYKAGYENSINKTEEFTFSGTFEYDKHPDVRFEVPNDKGGSVEGHIYFDDFMRKVNFSMNQPYMGNGPMFDSMFSPVLD